MNKIYKKLSFCLIGAFFLLLTATAQEPHPCFIGPKTIRAYSIADTNSICLVWPANGYRLDLRVARRVFSNRPKDWQNWTEIYAVPNPDAARVASQFCDTNVVSGIHYEYRLSAHITNYVCDFRTEIPYWQYQYISTGTDL